MKTPYAIALPQGGREPTVRDASLCSTHLQGLPWSTSLDDLGRTLVEQFEPDRTAEFARAVRGPGARSFDEQAARFIQHRGGQRHLRAVDGGECRDRRIAMAVENPQHLALGIGAVVSVGIIDQ